MNRVLSTMTTVFLFCFLIFPFEAMSQTTEQLKAHYAVTSTHENAGGNSKRITWVESYDMVVTKIGEGVYTFKKIVSVIENLRVTPTEVEESDEWSSVVINNLETLRFSYVTHPNYVNNKTFGHVKVQRKGKPDAQHPVFVTIEKKSENYFAIVTIIFPNGEKVITEKRYHSGMFDMPLQKKVTHKKADGSVTTETSYALLSMSKK